MASEKPISVVGVGASAGGLAAIEAMFRPMPADTGLGFVIVTHLARGQHSSLAEILRRHTVLPVKDAEADEEIRANHIYFCPPDHILTVAEGTIRLKERTSDVQHWPIDVFLSSLAADRNENCVGILLSGAGTDGTLGMRAIKERGGLTLAQGRDGSAPAQSGMPDAAVAAGVVDLVLSVEDMAARLEDYARDAREHSDAVAQEELEHEAEVRRAVCQILLKQVGHDFSGYKDKTFMRRVRRRMQVLQLTGLDRYLQTLRDSSEEVSLLFRDLLIGVTNFFRDAGAFDALARKVVPALFENKGAADTIRVWVPGCATGEEVYSIAILLREHMDNLRAPPKVQIFATDIDEAALSVARLGRYPAPLVEQHLSAQRLRRFFTGDDTNYQVNRDVRDLCMFSTHSIVRDPPFSRIDLVSCRNLLIYFGVAFQAQAIPIFHFSLRARGYLFLGTSENVTKYSDLFAPFEKKHRIFQRRDNVTSPIQFSQFRAYRQLLRPSDFHGDQSAMAPNVRRALESAVLDRHSPAHVVVNSDGEVLHYSPRTGKYLEPPAGSPSRQLVAMARRGLRLDIRAALREAIDGRRAVERDNIAIELDDRVQLIKLSIEPFGDNDGDPLYVVVFHDLGPPFSAGDVQKKGDAAGESETVDQLERDLRDTRQRLQATIEEYETALEELKSSNEELQSINEELQSANEELETSKEELQSINEELHTVNSELNEKIEEVDHANADLKNVFDSTQIATVFLDRNLLIRSFTPAVTSIFNLISTDRGRPLTDIVDHLDSTGDLRRDIQVVLETGQRIERAVKRADGTANYLMRVLAYRGRHEIIDGVLVTFIDVTRLIEAEANQRMLVEEFNHRVRNIFAVVGAFARQSSARGGAPAGFINDLVGRIHAMDRSYALVSRAKSGEVSLHDLLMEELSSAQGRSRSAARVTVEGIPVGVKPQAALALSLVIHELASNAQKHGALSTPKGRLNVRWTLGNPHGALLLIWEEKGGKKLKRPAKGFGLELVERELKSALGAKADFAYGAHGLTVRIVMPEEPRRWGILSVPADKS